VTGGPDRSGPAPWTGPDTSAAALSEDAIVRHRGDRPRHGWRRALLLATGGVVNPGIGPQEELRQQWRARIRRPLRGVHRIAVVSVKGGVGKTTVAACLGLALAENRGDRVVVQVARHLGLAARLHVLAGDQDPRISEALERAEHERLSGVLARFHDVVLTDCGTGLVHPVVRAALDLADGLVVVGAPAVDGASRASATLDWLDAHGYGPLAADAVVALAADRTSAEVDRERIRAHFAARARAVVEIPHDPHLATGAVIDPDRLQPATRDAFLLLAALVADRFGALR
jgi:MinD-like ATPase involved in chromosome partitioning or flagellar assembly